MVVILVLLVAIGLVYGILYSSHTYIYLNTFYSWFKIANRSKYKTVRCGDTIKQLTFFWFIPNIFQVVGTKYYIVLSKDEVKDNFLLLSQWQLIRDEVGVVKPNQDMAEEMIKEREE